MLPVALKAAGAAAAGAIVVLAVAAGSTGGIPAGAGWAALAGAFACVSGLVLGTGGRRAPAAAFGVAALTALVIAPTGGEQVRAAPRVLAMKAPADAERLRGDASTTLAHSERLRGDASVAARGENPTGANAESGDDSAQRGDDSPERGDDAAAAGVPNPTGRLRGDVSRDRGALVRAYYAHLDARRYDAAWARLAPAVQRSFGGFEAWRAGYDTTVGHDVEDLTAEGNDVTHTLVASCGNTTGTYAVSWRFEGAKAVGVSAAVLSGTAC